MEYCCFSYAWLGRGWTQEISWLKDGHGNFAIEWEGRLWIDFLDSLAERGWELVSTVPLGGGKAPIYGLVAYFRKRKS